MRTFLSQVNVVSVFPYALILGLVFFDFQILFFFVSRGFLFFCERESMGLFCLLETRFVKM